MRSRPSPDEERFYEIESYVEHWFRHPGDPEAEEWLIENCNRPFLVDAAIRIAKRVSNLDDDELESFKTMIRQNIQ